MGRHAVSTLLQSTFLLYNVTKKHDEYHVIITAFLFRLRNDDTDLRVKSLVLFCGVSRSPERHQHLSNVNPPLSRYHCSLVTLAKLPTYANWVICTFFHALPLVSAENMATAHIDNDLHTTIYYLFRVIQTVSL